MADIPLSRTLKRRLEELGASIDWSPLDRYHYTVDAPIGKIWAGTDVHGMVFTRAHDQSMLDFYDEILEGIKDGLEDCPFRLNPDCDVCDS